MDDQKHHLLICTVGTTPQPIIAAIRYWAPARTLFLPSNATREHVDTIRADVNDLLAPGSWEVEAVTDAEDFNECVRQMRRLNELVTTWWDKGPEYDVIADFTGGTKCMSAALSAISRRWPCRFSYIGGERTEGKTGIVVSGKERVLVTWSPWNALGYQAIEDACLLFDQHAFMPAAKLLTEARKAADDAWVKRTLATFHQLCEGYGFWDRFRHKDALAGLDDVLKNASDLQTSLGRIHAEQVLRVIKQNRKILQEILDRPNSHAMVADLLANAGRRRHEARYDDGVARLYRAIECIAQLALEDCHHIADTGGVPLASVPEPLRERWRSRDDGGGTLRLGLQDDYELLDALDDETGRRFEELGLRDRTSSLNARNSSILAHGFTPVAEEVFQRLWEATIRLGDFSEQDLPNFPQLTRH